MIHDNSSDIVSTIPTEVRHFPVDIYYALALYLPCSYVLNFRQEIAQFFIVGTIGINKKCT